MSTVNQGDVTKVLVGTVKLMVAPKGTALPDFTGDAIVWPVGWVNPGYTEDGLTLSIAPTTVEVTVDEEADPIDEILDKVKTSVAAKLSQNTLDNLQMSIAGATLTSQAADATHIGTATLDGGGPGATITEQMVAFEGKSPAGFWRVFYATRAKAKANVQQTFKRAGKQVIPVEFTILADSATGRPYRIIEKTANKTA